MHETLRPLYELQQIDLALAKAQKTKANLDDGSAKRQQVEAARAKSQEADKLLHEATAEMQDKELNLKTVEAKQKSVKDKLYGGSVSSPKELDSMEKDVEMLGRQKGKLEERILELLDIIEERRALAAAAKAALEAQEAELGSLLDRMRQESEALSVRIQELTCDREKAAPAVDAVFLKRYESMRGRLGGVAVSRIEEGHCSACHTQINSGLMRQMKADKDLLTCDNCSRMLYLE